MLKCFYLHLTGEMAKSKPKVPQENRLDMLLTSLKKAEAGMLLALDNEEISASQLASVSNALVKNVQCQLEINPVTAEDLAAIAQRMNITPDDFMNALRKIYALDS